MKTIQTLNLTAINNAENKYNSTTNTSNTYKTQILEILDDPKTTLSDFIDEQFTAIALSRLLWLKPWSMLVEQMKYLFWWLNKQNKAEYPKIISNISFTWAPNLEPKVLGWLAA